MSTALDKLKAAQARRQSILSAGLEPCPQYLFPGMTGDIAGYKACLRSLISAAHEHVCAFKLNLAFFEALGRQGWDRLYAVREMIPEDCLVIADAKRSDIGTSAERYALAIFDHLGADAVTVNPLMGRDSCEPFLRHAHKLTFLLALTSNPGADDFLLREGFYERVIERSMHWSDAGNIGYVVGATRPEYLARARQLAGEAPFLVPGVGAQGGDAASLAGGLIPNSAFPGLIVHATRALLPTEADAQDPRAAVATRAGQLREQLNNALLLPGATG